MRSIIERNKIPVPSALPDRYAYGASNNDKIHAAALERQQFLTAIIEATEKGETPSPRDSAAIAQVKAEIAELNSRIVEPMPIHITPQGRRGVSRPGHPGRNARSIGEEIIESLGRGGGIQAAFDGTSGGTAAPTWFRPGLLEMPHRRRYLRDLIPSVPVTSDKVDYVKQTVNTNAAAAVSAGGQKPKSTYTIARQTATIAVIAHMSEAIDRSLLADYDAAVAFVNDVLTIGVLEEEEDQLLNGSGVAPNLTGILNTAGIQTQALGTDPRFDAIHKSLTKVRLSNFEPDGIVMHPNDWEQVRLTRTADGEYIQGAPFEEGAEQLFGKPVITTTVLAEGTALVGAFAQGATVYDREAARVSFAETGLGDTAGYELFDRNQVRFRGESRIGLGVQFPLAFCTLTGI